MKNAIWATFYHYSSTDKKRQHAKCPQSEDSWCSYQRATTKRSVKKCKHDYQPLPKDVLSAIKPVYQDLSSDALLERCVGGFTQNINESYNQLIWKISPKVLPGGSLLQMMMALGIRCRPNSHNFAEKADGIRVTLADKRVRNATREGRDSRRQSIIDYLEAAEDASGLLYGPGIDDSV